LQVSGAGAAAAQAGGIAAILASGRTPAYAQQTTLHWLRWNDFVPASDQLRRSKIAPQCEKDLGITLNIEGVSSDANSRGYRHESRPYRGRAPLRP
jgi:multiple sugar transport system substrate-binding protein